MVNFGPLTTEICWRVWGTSANFSRFCVLASLLHRRRSAEVNKTLKYVSPSSGLVRYIGLCIFPGSCPVTEFCQLQNSRCVQVLRSPIFQRYCAALEQRPSAKLCGVVYKKWNYGTFAESATYIRLGGHHAEHRSTF